MATQDRSPSLIIFQQWSALADLVSAGTENEKDETPDKDGNRNSSGDSMKLGKQDMSLFGFCPSRDEFSLVVCEKCNLLVKPQALRQHIESRHGLTNLSSLGSISASALNSELGKKLLMPLPIKSNPLPDTASSAKRASDTFKPVSAGRLPTKASLKQVPASMKNSSVPILGGGMKINITKPVKSGNRLTPVKAATSSISNPIVKVEKLDKMSISSSSSKPTLKPEESEPPLSELSKNILNIDSTKISTLLNGSIKSVVSLTTPPSALTTSSSSMLSPVVSTAVTKASTDTLLSSRNVVNFVNTTSLAKSQMMAPVMTVGSNGSLAVHRVTSAKNMKLSKDQKERKFLPCKDREYDANKHCGVSVSDTGKPCTRSLTCKTHALSLRRAVLGRSKSFDCLLKEHKAVKDAILKAKAEAQNAATGASTMNSTQKGLVSSVAAKSALNAAKQQMMTPVISFQNDGKLAHSVCSTGATRTTVSSNSISTTAAPFAKPHFASNVFQRFTSSVLHPMITVKEETAGNLQESSSRLPVSSEVSQAGVQELKHDHNFISHHPRPLSCNHFGGRLSDRSCTLFSRKMDYVKAALLSALQRQQNPPPHKKLCVESNLPKDSGVLNRSQDPYEFNLDASGGIRCVSPAVVSPLKPVLKPKSKFPASPVTASSFTANQSLNLCSETATAALPISASPVSTLCVTPIETPSASPSSIAINWPIKTWGEVTSHNSSTSQSTVQSSTQLTHPGSRKRSGSSTSLNGQLMTVASGNGTVPVHPAASLTMTLTTNTPGGTGQQTGLIGVITPTNLNSHQTGNLIAIPRVSLSNSSFGQQNMSNLYTGKITTSAGGASAVTSHKNIFKDFNFVLRGIDSSLINGQQYVNITSAQLAELTTIQGQTLFLNSFTQGDPSSSSASGTIHGINRAGSLPTARPAKRSRSSVSKPHPALISSDRKISTSALETYKLVPTSSLQPTAVLMDGGSLQDAMFTLATGGTAPTLVAIASSTDNTNSAMMVGGNPSQVLCADSTSVINSSALVNGISQSTRDNCGSISQHHHHSSSSKSHHQHHHHHHQEHSKTQQQQPDIFVSSVLQGVPSVAIPVASAAATQLCSSQTLLKPRGTLNLTAKSVAGKLAMQPMSLTFPISVSQAAGLAALTSGKPQQLQHQQQPHHMLSVTADGVGTGERDPATAVLVTGKTDRHLQSQISGTSASSLIS